ncbi:MAG: hypothetical protein JST40_13605 [Armatimonadetes bacterium]|nr:hypothetical protein [Armatimonadota bacterium]
MRNGFFVKWLSVSVAVTCAVTAHCQFQVIDLSSAYNESYLVCADRGYQGGTVVATSSSPYNRASLWHGSAASRVDLNPSGYTSCGVHDIGSGTQVGFGYTSENGPVHAMLWAGSAASAVDLNPSNAPGSSAYCVDGSTQGGFYYLPSGEFHAVIWHGSAGSAIDLNPAGITQSLVNTAADGFQFGYGSGPVTSNYLHALMWRGTAKSATDLHPNGYLMSEVQGASHGVQVGYALSGNQYRAMLWRGSKSSYVDLNPIGITSSFATDCSANLQVGYGYGPATGNITHAFFWRGTAASAFDLHSLLPPQYVTSSAIGCDDQGNIVGRATDSTGSSHAVIWKPILTYYGITQKWFQPVRFPAGIYWQESQNYAVLQGGYLACPSNALENEAVYNLVADLSFWSDPGVGDLRIGPWLGGYHDYNQPWKWVNGSTFGYTNWYPGQPDYYLGAYQKLGYYDGAQWEDLPGTPLTSYGPPKGFVIEYDRAPVTGVVNLEDLVGDSDGHKMTVETIQNGSVVGTQQVTIQSGGYYRFTPPISGQVTFRLKPKHWLGRLSAPMTVGTTPVYDVDSTFLNGDLDGDNSVTVFDYLVLSDYFDAAEGDLNWGSVGSNGFAPKDADLDDDGSVTVFDYLIISKNFDLFGE